MIEMGASGVGACWIFLGILLFANCVNNFEQCTNRAFVRRPELDNVTFNQSLITESRDVESPAWCVHQCVQTDACNMVLYRQTSRTCKMYTEALSSAEYGTPDTGWQYYGVPCQDYRMENGRPGVHVLTANQSSLCDSAFCNNASRTTSCRNGERWQEMSFKCATTATYHGDTYPTMNPSNYYYIVLPFKLVSGSHIHLEVAGDLFLRNKVTVEKSNLDVVYHFFIDWNTTPIEALFNTMYSGTWHTSVLMPVSISGRDRYTLEIVITDTDFETYFNGSLLMTNLQRLALQDIRQITLEGFTALYNSFITYSGC